MRSLLHRAERAARAPVSVLILGETGVGKEVVARHIHRHSPRASRSLVTVNCGAIPDGLLPSTLFGHVRGAFTGASEARAGLFEQADGGTLFLDEVGELSLDAQVSLLRVLETGRLTRVGSDKERAVDVRLIAATHRDLEARVRDGAFREDLLYRLNAVTLHVKPLRERMADLRPLAQTLLAGIAARWEVQPPAIAETTFGCFERYAFPGNVRELRNVLEHTMVACEGAVIAPEHLPAPVRAAGTGAALAGESGAVDHHGELPFRKRIEAYEAGLIREALERMGGNQTRAAVALRIPRRTLVHKLRSYRIEGGEEWPER